MKQLEQVRNKEFFDKFKKLFEEEKSRLLFNNSVINEEYSINKEEMKDEIDFMSYELQNQMLLRMRSREALYLKKIEASLEAIRNGTFGQCGDCEEFIEQRRLEARPTTTQCLICKEASEQTEHAHIDGHRSKSLGKKYQIA